MEPFTLTRASRMLADETLAWQHMEQTRWSGDPVCPHCHSTDVRLLAPRAGSRSTRSGRVSHRRVWRCSECRRQFSVLVGTIFEGSKIPLGKWLMAIYLMSSAGNGVSAYELHRDLQVTYKSAWFMVQRLKGAIMLTPAAALVQDTATADGRCTGRPPKRRSPEETEPVRVVPGERQRASHPRD